MAKIARQSEFSVEQDIMDSMMKKEMLKKIEDKIMQNDKYVMNALKQFMEDKKDKKWYE